MPLPMETFFHIALSALPFCHPIPFLGLLWSSLSERKALDETPSFPATNSVARWLAFALSFSLSLPIRFH